MNTTDQVSHKKNAIFPQREISKLRNNQKRGLSAGNQQQKSAVSSAISRSLTTEQKEYIRNPNPKPTRRRRWNRRETQETKEEPSAREAKTTPCAKPTTLGLQIGKQWDSYHFLASANEETESWWGVETG